MNKHKHAGCDCCKEIHKDSGKFGKFIGKIFNEKLLMGLAIIGAIAIGEYWEAAGVLAFYAVGELCQHLAVKKAKKSITSLMDIRPDYANILTTPPLTGHPSPEGNVGAVIDRPQTQQVPPETVKPGDLILIKPGERVPLDGIVIEGESMLDTAALTGEAVPRRAAAGDEILSGSVNLNGVLRVRVTKIFGESTVSKIIALAQNAAEKKAPTEKFITKFAKYYTPFVVLAAALLAVIPPLAINMYDGAIWEEWGGRALTFLVISCPCALVISIPLGFFGGIGGASRRGILIKGGNYLEALNKLEIAVFDKTGTLTKGVFEVREILPQNGFSEEKVLELAALAEQYSTHPIAKSILAKNGPPSANAALPPIIGGNYEEVSGMGIKLKVDGAGVTLAGNAKLLQKEGVNFEENESPYTKVYVAENGVFAGVIIISDEIKEGSRETISALKKSGIKTVMLTGDSPKIAKSVAEELGVDEVYAGLLPQDKVEKVEELARLKTKNGKLAFMGDGINDAPVLALADIGISMGGLGSDAAIEAADMVIMSDEPQKLIEARGVAKRTKRIVWQNIALAFLVKGVFLALGAAGIATMWEAVFADVGVALIAVLNSVRVMRSKKAPQN